MPADGGMQPDLLVVPRNVRHRFAPELEVACSYPFQSPQYAMPLTAAGWFEMTFPAETVQARLSEPTLDGVMLEPDVNPLRARFPWYVACSTTVAAAAGSAAATSAVNAATRAAVGAAKGGEFRLMRFEPPSCPHHRPSDAPIGGGTVQ